MVSQRQEDIMEQTTQALLSVGMPTLAVQVGILVNNSRLSDLRARVDAGFSAFEKFIDVRFETAHQELLRVEGVLDARLNSLESRLDHLERR
jgi:hypothetical protein